MHGFIPGLVDPADADVDPAVFAANNNNCTHLRRRWNFGWKCCRFATAMLGAVCLRALSCAIGGSCDGSSSRRQHSAAYVRSKSLRAKIGSAYRKSVVTRVVVVHRVDRNQSFAIGACVLLLHVL